MTDMRRLELVNRVDLLKEVHSTLKSDLSFWLRQKDWKRVAEIRRRIKACDERLATVLYHMAH